MRYKNTFLFILCFPVIAGKCQDIQAKQIPLIAIKNVDWKKVQVEDTRIFDAILEKRDILILSEINHGDGISYEAQCMILKALIDSNKISKIYTESSWLNLDKINSLLKEKGKAAIDETIKYMRSTELKYWVDNGFWEFLVPKIITGEIELVGIDIDGISPYIIEELVSEAQRLRSVREYQEINKEKYKTLKFDYDNFSGWNTFSRYGEEGYLLQKEFIDLIMQEYKDEKNVLRVKQWRSVLNLFYWMYKRGLVLAKNRYSNEIVGDKQFSSFMKIRDSLMAEILLEDYRRQPQSKVVVLISAFHSLRNSAVVEGIRDCCMTSDTKVFGEMIDSELGEKIYSMAFVPGSGERGTEFYFTKSRNTKIAPPPKNSLEFLLRKSDFPYCLIDFDNSILKDSAFYMNVVFDKYLRSRWSVNYNGIFFIKKMQPLSFKNKSTF